MPRRAAVSVLALLAACGIALADAGAHITPAPQPLTVPTASGPRTFFIDSPDAPSSPAARDDSAELDPITGKPRPAAAGYRLTSRIIIQSPSAAAITTALTRANSAHLKPAPAVADFYLIDAPSIRAAAALATQLQSAPGITLAYLDIEWPKALRSIPTDPLVPQQWHLINTVNPLFDTNADAAWMQGFTGAGVTVGILEGGFDVTHEDLAPNFNPDSSQSLTSFSDHGTSTAGLVAAVADNNKGGAGVAFGARLAKLYYGSPSDINTAFTFAPDTNAVLTNSWGPFDNGRIAIIDPLELAGIQSAATTGRAGKGDVIVWAAGNGGLNNNDRVDYDPYASNRFSIAIGSIDALDRKALYSEPGSALMLVTCSDYDLSSISDQGIVTSAGNNGYTTSFGGTSAASPIAAGVVALILQANPNLSARDVQHILIRSARLCNPADPAWAFNASGNGALHRFNEKFGFGAIDAGAATTLAQSWTNRPPESSILSPVVSPNTPIPDNDPAGITSTVQITGSLIVERAQLVITALHPAIGNLRITLTSPGGTTATLADTRFDTTSGAYNNYTFSPAKFWDERAAGTWTLRVTDTAAGSTGTLNAWQLKLYGYQPPCPCDWNLSNQTTLQDLFDFLASYFAGHGDLNADGVTSVQDIFDYLTCYFAGC